MRRTQPSNRAGSKFAVSQRSAKGFAPKRARVETRVNTAMQRAPRAGKDEIKHVDLPRATYLVNTTPVFTLVNLVNSGDLAYGRDGDAIKAKSIYVTGAFNPLRTSTLVDYARLLIVWCGAPRGAAPAIDTILADVDNAGAVTTNASSGTSVESRKTIKILADIRVKLDPVTVTAGVLSNNAMSLANPDTRIQFEKYVKLKDALVGFNRGTAGTIADMDTGAIFVVTIGSAAPGAEGWNCQYATRFVFKE